MSEKHLSNDTYRFSREKESLRIKEAQERLIKDAENTLVNTLLSAFGNAKLAKETEMLLERVEGPTSDSLLFSGKLTLHAEIDHSRKVANIPVEVSVKDNNFEFPSKEDLVHTVEAIKEAEQKVVSEEPEVIEVPLNQFSFTDDGNKYLHVYHPALHNIQIGIVGENEYDSVEDKEAFLKEMFINKFASTEWNHHTVEFTGEFKEPTIEVKAEDAFNPELCSCEAKGEKCSYCEEHYHEKKASEIIEPSKELSMTDLPLANQADSFRQTVEREEQKVMEAKRQLELSLSRSIVAHLYNLQYGSVKINEIDSSSLSHNEQGFTGNFFVTASVEDRDGLRIVTFPIEVSASVPNLPKKEAVQEALSKAIDVKSRLQEELAKEVVAKMAEIDAMEVWKAAETENVIQEEKIETEVSLKKEAADNMSSTQYIGPNDTLVVNKHLLEGAPELEIGDTIFADGHIWKLTCKNVQQLSTGEADASLYTFVKVAPEKEEPKIATEK